MHAKFIREGKINAIDTEYPLLHTLEGYGDKFQKIILDVGDKYNLALRTAREYVLIAGNRQKNRIAAEIVANNEVNGVLSEARDQLEPQGSG